MRRRVIAVALAMCLGGGVGATALAHEPEPPPAVRCAQGAGALPGGPFLFAGEVNGGVGIPCRYTAVAGGGYLAVGDAWRVVVEKLDGRTRVFASVLGSSPCWEDVIDPGDTVEAWSSVAVVTGPDVDC